MKGLTLDHLDLLDNNMTTVAVEYVSGTTLKVKSSANFAINKYILLGKYGLEQSEIVRITAIPDVDTLTITSAEFPHSVDTTITVIPADKFRVYRSTTGVGGSYTLIDSVDIMVDSKINNYIDLEAQQEYSYKFAYYNTILNVEILISGEIPFGGFPDWSLQSIQDNILELFCDNPQDFITRKMITVWVNELYRRCQFLIQGSESPYDINYLIIDGNDLTEFDISSYEMIGIYMAEISTDGGITYGQVVTPKDARAKDLPGSIGIYDYRLAGNKLIFNPKIPLGTKIRVWYTTLPVSLVNPSDTLKTPLKTHTYLFTNYGLQRAYEKDKKLAEMAPYYRNMVDKDMNIKDPESLISKIRTRIKQGNMIMNTSWSDDYDNF